MLRAIFADAVFCAALFVESLALLSIFQAVAGLELREEFTPILNSYHAKTAPLSVIGRSLFAGRPPDWYADAALIGVILFFLFFIAQARNAMAPYDDTWGSPIPEAKGVEAAIDFFLPIAVCAIGAAITAPTLLPFLTLPVALWLLAKRLFGKPSWFKVSTSYYVNIVLLATVAAAIFALAG
jgi:hypothetical protein